LASEKDRLLTRHQGLIFRLPSHRLGLLFYQFAVLYDRTSNLTQAILIGRRRGGGFDIVPGILDALGSQKALCGEPLLPTIAAEIQIIHTQEGVKDMKSKLQNLEEMIGQHESLIRPRGNPTEIDFEATTRKLNYISKKVGTKIVQMKSMLQILAKMREFKADIDKNARSEAKSRGSR
jgi:hypothetical protein